MTRPSNRKSVAQGLLLSGSGHRAVAQTYPGAPKIPRYSSKNGRLRHQVMNLALPRRVRAWGDGSLKIEAAGQGLSSPTATRTRSHPTRVRIYSGGIVHYHVGRYHNSLPTLKGPVLPNIYAFPKRIRANKTRKIWQLLKIFTCKSMFIRNNGLKKTFMPIIENRIFLSIELDLNTPRSNSNKHSK